MRKNIAPSLMCSISLFIISTTGLPLAGLAQVIQAPTGHYDELFDEAGQLRPQYTPIEEQLNELSYQEEQRFLKSSKLEFQGDNSLSPIPRILSPQESAELRQGVLQRARAIVAFLKDHYSGQKTYAKANFISSRVVDQIIQRTGESGYQGKIDPETIAFMYGPDIIRDAQGTWRVIEDNPGFIGGVGDLKLAYGLSMKNSPELLKNFTFAQPEHFYQKVAMALKEQALAHGGKAILFAVPPYADNEDSRIRKIFSDLGIETITPHTAKKIQVTSRGVYTVQNVNGREVHEKVGYMFLNTEHAWIDRSPPAVRERYFVEQANNLLKEENLKNRLRDEILAIFSERESTGVLDLNRLEIAVRQGRIVDRNAAPGLMDAILSGKVGSNYSAGVDFIGDKLFYTYIEDMIRFYLKETPILRNIDTKSLATKSGAINSDLVKQIADNSKGFVLKKVDGRGGDAVWVGAKLKKMEMLKALDAARSNPAAYIVQKYTPLSVMHRQIVDLRSITAIFPNQIIVTETPWGRGLPLNGNGKVNLSDQGREVTVLSIHQGPVIMPVLCKKLRAL